MNTRIVLQKCIHFTDYTSTKEFYCELRIVFI